MSSPSADHTQEQTPLPSIAPLHGENCENALSGATFTGPITPGSRLLPRGMLSSLTLGEFPSACPPSQQTSPSASMARAHTHQAALKSAAEKDVAFKTHRLQVQAATPRISPRNRDWRTPLKRKREEGWHSSGAEAEAGETEKYPVDEEGNFVIWEDPVTEPVVTPPSVGKRRLG